MPFDWMQPFTTATNRNIYMVFSKFYLNAQRVKRKGLDRNPRLAKTKTANKPGVVSGEVKNTYL